MGQLVILNRLLSIKLYFSTVVSEYAHVRNPPTGRTLSSRESYLTSLCMSHPSSKQTVLIHISVFFTIQSQTARKQQRETRAGGIRLREVIVPFDEMGQGNISVSM